MVTRQCCRDLCSVQLKGYERVLDFALTDTPFSVENGLLTPTLKLKRAQARERFEAEIAAMYASPVKRRG